MCKKFKIELDLEAEFDTEEFEKEMEELEKKVHNFLASDLDTRYEMTKFDFSEKL